MMSVFIKKTRLWEMRWIAEYLSDKYFFFDRINELTMLNERLKIQLDERDKTIATLQKTVGNLEVQVGSYDLPETDTARQVREETEALHLALRNIAEAVINDADQTRTDDEGGEDALPAPRSISPYRPRSISPTARAQSPLVRNRSPSPRGRSRSPAFADATFSAVQAALGKRQMQASIVYLSQINYCG